MTSALTDSSSNPKSSFFFWYFAAPPLTLSGKVTSGIDNAKSTTSTPGASTSAGKPT